MTTQPEATAPHPTTLVESAVEALVEQFYEPLDAATLFNDAWEGAAAALKAAGVAEVPLAPAYPVDQAAAAAVHAQRFPALEVLAEASIGREALAVSALRELGFRRRDGHTAFSLPVSARFVGPWMMGTLNLDFGFALSPFWPFSIASVAPGSPAQLAGLHRGLEVLAINGTSVERWHRMAAFGLLAWESGTPSTLRVRPPGGEASEVVLAPASAPLLRHGVAAGAVGLIRFDGFPTGEGGARLVAQLRAALEDFECRGITRWVLDLRWNQGGDGDTTVAVMDLFVNRGRLWRRRARVEVREADGTLLPRVRDKEAAGTALPFQRPLAVLVGPGSSSGAEVYAGALQALDRAHVVGEPTAGWLGSLVRIPLATGWNFSVTFCEILLGPELWQLNRIGLTPDLPVVPTVDDELAGRDPQLDAAIRFLQGTQ